MRGAFEKSGHWRGEAHDRYIELYKKAMLTRDAAVRKPIYHEMQRILHEEVPAILPAGGDSILVKRKYVRNLSYHPQIWSIKFDEVWKNA